MRGHGKKNVTLKLHLVHRKLIKIENYIILLSLFAPEKITWMLNYDFIKCLNVFAILFFNKLFLKYITLESNL